MENFKDCKVGEVLVSLERVEPYREVGDLFKVLEIGSSNMYYQSSTCSSSPNGWRKATSAEAKWHLANPKLNRNVEDMPKSLVPEINNNYSIF